MTPQSGPCGPIERGFVERIPCPDTEQLTASVGGLGQSYLPRFDELLNSKLALCNYVTAAVQAGLTPPRGPAVRATVVLLGSVGTRRYLRCTHSTYFFNEVRIGLLMRFGFIGSRPLHHLVPLFSSFPLHTRLFLLFSFMSSCLHVLSFHRFPSFAHAWPGP